ncbi:hypothetical protein GMA12_10780 [Kocuria sediminis]|uniref:DUF4439 domain-containing protein n=1 Tax=Kocuria sediminis TaxID=1038857 RepID=A0A6N8GS22_9MICC|nr:hypothetical protein [Kocuria sediminis]MUN63624.1 hypothetical protein [Kocuria sediminis]
MTDPRTPARRALPPLLAVLVVLLAAVGGWWLGAARPVPPDEVARADAWSRTEALLAHPSLEALEEGAAVRADLDRQLAALGPAPGGRAAHLAPADAAGPGAPADTEDLAGALARSAGALARDALDAEDPALARVLGAVAASRATTAGQLGGDAGAPELCTPGADPGSGATTPAAAALWSALDRAGYTLEALAARAAPAGAPADGPLRQARADVADLLGAPVARGVLAAEPGLRAGAYVLPGDIAEDPLRGAAAAAGDVQEAAAHALAQGEPATRCWALQALERAGTLRAELGGEVDALPGVLPDDRSTASRAP